MANSQKPKKMWNLVVSKPKNPNLTHNTAKNLKFNSTEKEEEDSFFFADTKPEAGQIKRKIVANFKKQLFN